MKKLRDSARKMIVVFIGLNADHRKVLCVQEDDRLLVPHALVPPHSHYETEAYDLKDTYIIDNMRFRHAYGAHKVINLPHKRISIDVFVHAEIIDDACWMRFPHQGVWVPSRSLLDHAHPLVVWEALLALEHKDLDEYKHRPY